MARERAVAMFNDLFNFGKQRSPKQALGFFLFYACLFMGFGGIMTILGF
jgi:hypothetical protein